jgi:hypothetical protein
MAKAHARRAPAHDISCLVTATRKRAHSRDVSQSASTCRHDKTKLQSRVPSWTLALTSGPNVLVRFNTRLERSSLRGPRIRKPLKVEVDQLFEVQGSQMGSPVKAATNGPGELAFRWRSAMGLSHSRGLNATTTSESLSFAQVILIERRQLERGWVGSRRRETICARDAPLLFVGLLSISGRTGVE